MAKVMVRYVGPEAREFGGKVGTEKFTVPSKADKPDRAFEVSSKAVADVLATITGGGKFEGKPLYEVLEKLPEDEAEQVASGATEQTNLPEEAESVDPGPVEHGDGIDYGRGESYTPPSGSGKRGNRG